MDSRALIVLALVACTGPRPEAHVVSVAPSPQPGHERVVVDVDNAAGGHGQVELRIVLEGAHRVPVTRTVEIDAHEHLQVVVDVAAPPDVYTASVSAQYPD